MAPQGTNKRLLFQVIVKRRFNLLVPLLGLSTFLQVLLSRKISHLKSQSPGTMCPVHRDAVRRAPGCPGQPTEMLSGKLQLLWKMTNDHLASYVFRLVGLGFETYLRDTEHLDKHKKNLPVSQKHRCSMSRRLHGQMTGSFSFFLLLIQSVQFSLSVVSDSLQPRGLQHARPPCPSPTPGACRSSCLSSP